MVLWIFVIYDTRLFCYVIHLTLLWANEPIQGLACHIEAMVFSEPWCYTTNAYRRAKDESTDISCLMLGHMESDLQKQFENVEAYDMIESLKSMFQAQAKTERYQVSQALLSCKLKDGDPLSPHVIKMVGYVQSLERLGYPISEEFATDIILNSLPSAYGKFISNYHMHGMDKKLTELHGMLKQAEADLKKGVSQVLTVQNKAKFKKSSWTKKKAKSGGKQAQDL